MGFIIVRREADGRERAADQKEVDELPSKIQQKHFQEREAVVDEALNSSLIHLVRAHNQFGAAIKDRGLQDEFASGIDQAQQVLAKLGVEF